MDSLESFAGEDDTNHQPATFIRSLLRRSDLNATSSRYDSLLAMPSEQQQFIMWTTWAVLALVVATFVGIVCLSVLCSSKARGRSFNLYLVFLTFPDIFFSVACGVTCALNAAAGQYYSEKMCSLQAWYVSFAFTANAWLNAVTTRQVHDMLRRSHKRQRYQPPTRWRVVQHSLAVYIYSSIVASLSLFGTDVHKHYLATGLACLPLEHNKQSTLFFWLCYFWLLVGIPLFYVIYVWIDVRRKKLIPRKDGRTRSVAFFFLRLTGVFVFMWLPTIIAIYIIAGSSIYFAFLGGTWSHLQPAVSIGVSLLKGDIRQATVEFLTCRCRGGKNEESGDRQRPWERSFRHQQSIFSSFDRRLSSLSTGRRESDIVFSSYEQRPSSVVSTGRKESQDDDFEDNDDDSEKEEAYVPRSSHPLFTKKTDSEQTK